MSAIKTAELAEHIATFIGEFLEGKQREQCEMRAAEERDMLHVDASGVIDALVAGTAKRREITAADVEPMTALGFAFANGLRARSDYRASAPPKVPTSAAATERVLEAIRARPNLVAVIETVVRNAYMAPEVKVANVRGLAGTIPSEALPLDPEAVDWGEIVTQFEVRS